MFIPGQDSRPEMRLAGVRCQEPRPKQVGVAVRGYVSRVATTLDVLFVHYTAVTCGLQYYVLYPESSEGRLTKEVQVLLGERCEPLVCRPFDYSLT